VELHVLPRGDVTEAPRVTIGDARERLELRAGQDALRHFDAQHLRVLRLALSVGAAHEAVRPPLVGRDLAALELPQHADELVDLGLLRERQARASERLAIVDCSHMAPLCPRESAESA
jgi:hypothetical protein